MQRNDPCSHLCIDKIDAWRPNSYPSILHCDPLVHLHPLGPPGGGPVPEHGVCHPHPPRPLIIRSWQSNNISLQVDSISHPSHALNTIPCGKTKLSFSKPLLSSPGSLPIAPPTWSQSTPVHSTFLPACQAPSLCWVPPTNLGSHVLVQHGLGDRHGGDGGGGAGGGAGSNSVFIPIVLKYKQSIETNHSKITNN